jgi:hypothetical protein
MLISSPDAAPIHISLETEDAGVAVAAGAQAAISIESTISIISILLILNIFLLSLYILFD